MEKVHEWTDGGGQGAPKGGGELLCLPCFFPCFYSWSDIPSTLGSFEAAFFTMSMIILHNDNQVLFDLPVEWAESGVSRRRLSVSNAVLHSSF